MNNRSDISVNSIPKTIHYCWFGGNPLPKSARKCIESWKRFFPDYEIIEWNESNYDVNKIRYISQAYSKEKYAFVSDYARFDVLYQYGGVYFDTDVEVIRPFDDILSRGAFMGCEIDGDNKECAPELNKRGEIEACTNPGLGIAAAPGLRLYREILDYYEGLEFELPDGSYNTETVVSHVTKILRKHGLRNIREIQEVEGIAIYPSEYFNPLNSLTGELTITENTRSIHWYTASWLTPVARVKASLGRRVRRLKKVLSRCAIKNEY